MFVIFNIIYISVTLLFLRDKYQVPGIINFIWIRLGGIDGAWFIDVYNNTRNTL